MTCATVVMPAREKETQATAVREGARLLREGKLVAFPTETVYGLGVRLDNPEALARLYAVKGRPQEKKLTMAVSGRDDLKKYNFLLSPLAERLARRFWPGPLTLLLPDGAGNAVGVRIPGHPVAKALLEEAAVPVGLPSANPSGQKPPRSAEAVLAYFDGAIDLVLDGGETALGVSSTVVDVTGPSWRLIREGAISREEIEAACQG